MKAELINILSILGAEIEEEQRKLFLNPLHAGEYMVNRGSAVIKAADQIEALYASVHQVAEVP